jgi:DSF synthase
MSNAAFEHHLNHLNLPEVNFHTSDRKREQARESQFLELYYDPTYGALWQYFKPESPSKLTEPMISALREQQIDFEAVIRQDLAHGDEPRIKYQITSSRIPGIFSLGGDLELFQEKIKSQDREGLKRYAQTCVDLVYNVANNFGLPVTTIALVQGTALGGGFEGALAHNVLIAERHCQMGLPEIMFNLFPGMGAYQLLCRRLPPAKAEQFILSGRTFSAEELYEMGIVDVIADKGKGEQAVWDYIRGMHGKSGGRNALRSVIMAIDPINQGDLTKSTDIWVDTALKLSDADLKKMTLLVRAQQRAGY